MKMLMAFVMVVVATSACATSVDTGDDDGTSDQGSGSAVMCTLGASASPNTSSRTIAASGTLMCNGTASLHVETCVQWKTSSTAAYSDITCQSSTMSGVADLALDTVASCGISTGRMFRARVNAAVNGTNMNETLSAEVKCD